MMLSDHLTEALTERSPMPSLRGRKPFRGGQLAGTLSQLAALLKGAVDKDRASQANARSASLQNLHWASSIFGKLSTGIHSDGTPTRKVSSQLKSIRKLIDGASKAASRGRLDDARKMSHEASSIAARLFQASRKDRTGLWAVLAEWADESMREWNELVELRDLSKEIHTSRHKFKDPTAAQHRSLRTPGVASPKASSFHADEPTGKSYQRVHPSRLPYGAMIMFKGKQHTVVGKKGKKTTLRDPKNKIFDVDLSMDPTYKGVMGRAEDVGFDEDFWEMFVEHMPSAKTAEEAGGA